MSGTAAVGGISIPIFAVDNATAVINRVNKSIAGMTQGTTRFGQATRSATDVNMVNRLSQGFSGLGRAAFDVFKSVERTVPLLGVIGSGSIIGGVVALEKRWGELGQKISNTAVRLGITTTSLTSWQGAARLAGGSAEDMTAGLASLDELLRGATFRGDANAIQFFRKLNVNFGEMGVKARLADDAMGDVAEGIAKVYREQGRGAAFRLAQTAGLEALFPQLIKGRAAWEAYRKDAERLGMVLTPPMIQRAELLRNSFSRLGGSIEGFANRISDSLAPVITPLLNQMADLIGANSAGISQDIGKYVQDLATWIKQIDWTKAKEGAHEFWEWLKSIYEYAVTYVIPALKPFLPGEATQPAYEPGGSEAAPAEGEAPSGRKEPGNWLWQWWRGGRSARPGILGGTGEADLSEDQTGTGGRPPWHFPWPHLPHFEPAGGAPISVPQAPSAAAGAMRRVHDFFAAKGLSEDNISGILANVGAESGFDPSKWGDKHSSYGLFQEHATRLEAMQQRYGATPSADEQLEYAWNEPQMRRTLEMMRGRGASDSGAIFSRGFEVPAGGAAEDMRRGAAAPQFGHVQVDVNVKSDRQVSLNARGSGIASTPRVSAAMPAFGLT